MADVSSPDLDAFSEDLKHVLKAVKRARHDKARDAGTRGEGSESGDSDQDNLDMLVDLLKSHECPDSSHSSAGAQRAKAPLVKTELSVKKEPGVKDEPGVKKEPETESVQGARGREMKRAVQLAQIERA